MKFRLSRRCETTLRFSTEHFARNFLQFLIADSARYRKRNSSMIVITRSRIIFTRKEQFAIFRRRVDY